MATRFKMLKFPQICLRIPIMKIFPKDQLARAYDLLKTSFDLNELGSLEQLERHLQDPRYKIYCYEDEGGELTGLQVLWEETNFVFGAYVVVRAGERNRKLGRTMILDALRYCDAEKKLFVAEVEPLVAPFSKQRIEFSRKNHVRMNPADYLAELIDYAGQLEPDQRPDIYEVSHPDSIIPERRIGYYLELGMRLNTYEYVQPALEKDTAPVKLNIMSYPRELTPQEFEEFRSVLYREMYKTE